MCRELGSSGWRWGSQPNFFSGNINSLLVKLSFFLSFLSSWSFLFIPSFFLPPSFSPPFPHFSPSFPLGPFSASFYYPSFFPLGSRLKGLHSAPPRLLRPLGGWGTSRIWFGRGCAARALKTIAENNLHTHTHNNSPSCQITPPTLSPLPKNTAPPHPTRTHIPGLIIGPISQSLT